MILFVKLKIKIQLLHRELINSKNVYIKIRSPHLAKIEIANLMPKLAIIFQLIL